jgi:heme/copper-type cytochrome/quinol oxidase subunit 2
VFDVRELLSVGSVLAFVCFFVVVVVVVVVGAVVVVVQPTSATTQTPKTSGINFFMPLVLSERPIPTILLFFYFLLSTSYFAMWIEQRSINSADPRASAQQHRFIQLTP